MGFPIHERAGRRGKTGVLEPQDRSPQDHSPRTRPGVSTADSSGRAVSTADSSQHRPTSAPQRPPTPRHRQPPASCSPPQGMPLPSLWVPFRIPATKPPPRAPQHARGLRPSHLHVPPHPDGSPCAAPVQAVCYPRCPTARTQPSASAAPGPMRYRPSSVINPHGVPLHMHCLHLPGTHTSLPHCTFMSLPHCMFSACPTVCLSSHPTTRTPLHPIAWASAHVPLCK